MFLPPSSTGLSSPPTVRLLSWFILVNITISYSNFFCSFICVFLKFISMLVIIL
jgi:hypothetical protein